MSGLNNPSVSPVLQDDAPRKEKSKPKKDFPYFGLEVADGVKFQPDFGGQHKYGLIKVCCARIVRANAIAIAV